MEILIRKARKSDLKGIIRVNVETWKKAYKGVVPDNYIQAFIIRSQDKTWQNQLEKMVENYLFFVAETNKNEIVGFAIGGAERNNHPNYKGELMGMYILSKYQRRGIGKSLTRKIIEGLLTMNINTMLVWVLENNPYRAFYESIGGIMVERKLDDHLNLPVVAYGYDNLKKLIEKL